MKRKSKSFTVSDIALGNLRRRRRQYVLLGIAIVLAIYFTAASLLFGYGLYTSFVERRANQFGDYNVALYGLDDKDWDDVAADKTISSLGRAEVLALAVIGDTLQNTFPIAKYDTEAIVLTRRRLKEGAFPAAEGQIALSQAALARLRTDAGIGDTITLTLRIPDEGDYIPETVEKTYLLTGILYDQKIPLVYSGITGDNTDYAAGMFSPAEQVEPGGRGVVVAYGGVLKSDETFQHWIAFADSNNIDLAWNMSDLSLDADDYEMAFTGGCILIVGIVLVLACCLGIVNAFSANLDARRRQIGLLRAVGATRRQIRRIFRRETLIIALAAAPPGLGLAVVTVYGAFALLGEDLYFVPNPWVLVGVAAIGVISIIFSSGIPLRRAGAVSPMQAVRDVEFIRAAKKVKSRTWFDVARLTASRANRIYKTRKIGISIMLAAGILLFSDVVYIAVPMAKSAFAGIVHAQQYQVYGPYMSHNDVLVYGFHSPGLTEGDKLEIASLPLVTQVDGEKGVNIKILPEEITPYATWDGWNGEYEYLAVKPSNDPDPAALQRGDEEQITRYREAKAKYGYTGDFLNIECNAMEEDAIRSLESYVYEGQINIDKLHSGEEVLLVAPREYDLYYTSHIDEAGYVLSMKPDGQPGQQLITSQKNDMFHAGDTIAMSLLYTDGQEQWDDEGSHLIWAEDAVRIDSTAKIGALLDFSDDMLGLGVITTLPGLVSLGYDVPYQHFAVTLRETPDPETEAYIQDALEQIVSRIPGASLHSNLESARESRQLAVQLISVAAALVILMMAITVRMMNNTLSAHIRAGRRGIGTLRAVGVSDRIIFRSYLFQLLYLFVWGGSAGYVLGVVTGAVMQHFNLMGVQGAPIPYWQTLSFIAFLFCMCLINVRSRLKQVLRESVIDNIRVL